jgi:hypothetical protein
MSYRGLIFTFVTLVVVLGAAGAMTHGAKLAAPEPEPVAMVPPAKRAAYNGKALERAINVLQSSDCLRPFSHYICGATTVSACPASKEPGTCIPGHS